MSKRIGPVRPAPDGLRGLAVGPGTDSVAWIADGIIKTARLDSRATSLGLETSSISRMPTKYQHRPHYEGYYWFSGSGLHTWHESMEEYAALMWLDHRFDIVRIAAQPMCIFFADGSSHYPDYFAVHATGHQVLYDVRPEKLIDERMAHQIELTTRLCEKIGWGYEVLTGLTKVTRLNLELVAAYRHPRNRPDSSTTARILAAVGDGVRLDELASALDVKLRARHIHHIYNLIWTRRLEFDNRRPLNWATLIWKVS